MASISSAGVYGYFWNTQWLAVYRRCILPTETASPELHTTLSSGYSNCTERRLCSLWVHTQQKPNATPRESLLKISSASSPSLGRVFTERAAAVPAKGPSETTNVRKANLDPLRKNELWRSYKLKMYPDRTQRKALNLWFAAARWGYNQTVNLMREGKAEATSVTANKAIHDPPEAFKAVTNKIYKRAALQAVDAMVLNHKKCKEDPKFQFNLRYRSFRRSPQETLVLEKRTTIGRRKRDLSGLKTQLKSTQKRASAVASADPKHPCNVQLWFLENTIQYIDRALGLCQEYSKKAGIVMADIDETLVHEKGPVQQFLPATPKMIGKIAPHNQDQVAAVQFGSTMKSIPPVKIRDKNAQVVQGLVQDGLLLRDAQIVWDKRRHSYHLKVLVRKNVAPDPDPQGEHKRVVALDPGCRRFQQYYDPTDGQHGVLLDGYNGNKKRTVLAELDRRCNRIDHLRSRERRLCPRAEIRRNRPPRKPRKIETPPTRRQQLKELPMRTVRFRRWQRSQRLVQREHRRLMGWRENAHYAAIGFLLTNWDVVVYSVARFGQMCDKLRRVFNSRTARRAYTWCHYQFNERLISRANALSGKRLIPIHENGTTKTCGICGTANHNVGGAHTYVCPSESCGTHIDRDLNGARNNLLCSLNPKFGER